MEKLFKIGLVLGVLSVAFALFDGAQNGRYQHSGNGGEGVVLDTRTGEYWDAAGNHFEPRLARITMHSAAIDDETADDNRRNAFHDCIESHTDVKKCLADFDKPRTLPAPDSNSGDPPAK
jgi:hypothetical protein